MKQLTRHFNINTKRKLARLTSKLNAVVMLIALLSVTGLMPITDANASGTLPNSTIYVAEWSRLKHLAAEGNAEAQFQLGNMYYLPPKHSGIPKNFTKAFNLFEQAANQGHVTAQHNLAVLYYRGEGVGIDRVKAIAWFILAKDNGSKSAAKHLAELNYDLDSDTKAQVQLTTRQIKNQIQQAKTAK